MRNDQFYICDEDNVFAELDALYEDLQPCPFGDVSDLDPALEWDVSDYTDLLDDIPLEEAADGYGVDAVDFQRGDILLAYVYQPGPNFKLDHTLRPFLVTYANASRVYGFQLTTSKPRTLLNYLVEIPDYAEANLVKPSSFSLDMIRGVDRSRLKAYIGHITEAQKQSILNKLHDIKENKDELYTHCIYRDRIDSAIINMERIYC